jgi:septal ring factor EnvC (AmiA/AmiB activator)
LNQVALNNLHLEMMAVITTVPNELRVVACGIAIWLVAITPAMSTEPTPSEAQTKQELQTVLTRIERLTTHFNATQTREAALEAELRDIEVEVGTIADKLRKLRQNLQQRRLQLQRLRERRAKHQENLSSQREQLAQQLRTSYVMGRHSMLKILLNQEDPATLSRVLTYYGYLNRAHIGLISEVRSKIAQLNALEADILHHTSVLRKLETKQMQTTQDLEAQQTARQSILDQVRFKLRKQGRQLERLAENKRQLEQILSEIEHALIDIPTHLNNSKTFGALQGQLLWPSKGEIVHRYGSPEAPGQPKSKGVWIAGKEGQPVRTIWHGRVAFANWLRGFGLLIIIDHGHGYMSLYGHNQSLYKEVGDWVNAGEVVATMGQSGGRTEVALYFEIRHQGVPQDPSTWCRGHPPEVGKQDL